MSTFENTTIIERPADVVFGFLADLENLPRWNHAIERTTRVSPGPVGVGSVYRQIRSLPVRSEEGFEVTAYEPLRRLEIDGPFGPFRVLAGYRLEPVGAATRLVNSMRLEPLPGVLSHLAMLGVPTVKSAVAANLARLKEILENLP